MGAGMNVNQIILHHFASEKRKENQYGESQMSQINNSEKLEAKNVVTI